MVAGRIARPRTGEYDPYFAAYIDRVEGEDLLAELQLQIEELAGLLEGLSEVDSCFRYQPDKWSLKEVLGHLIDTERIFVFRALWFARGGGDALPGFDQEEFVRRAEFDERSLASLVAEFGRLRESTLDLLTGFQPDDWARAGISDGKVLSLRAIAYLIAGHVAHHLEILRLRYLEPLGRVKSE